MRIWSIHPKYLDSKGLVALWRETLLAKKVLEGHTKGYKNHPQLIRFKNSDHPLHLINQYLMAVYEESSSRGYQFNRAKINADFEPQTLMLTRGQMAFEIQHLLKKLKSRDTKKYQELVGQKKIQAHPLFQLIDGEIEAWEIV